MEPLSTIVSVALVGHRVDCVRTPLLVSTHAQSSQQLVGVYISYSTISELLKHSRHEVKQGL
jgi:hypothetical protein